MDARIQSIFKIHRYVTAARRVSQSPSRSSPFPPHFHQSCTRSLAPSFSLSPPPTASKRARARARGDTTRTDGGEEAVEEVGPPLFASANHANSRDSNVDRRRPRRVPVASLRVLFSLSLSLSFSRARSEQELNGQGYQIPSANRRRLRVYARVLRLAVLLVDAGRRCLVAAAVDARRCRRRRRRRRQQQRDHHHYHLQRGASAVAAHRRRRHRGR